MIASDHDIPFQSITYLANVSDPDLFPGMIDSICERLQNIDIPAEDMTIIFDRGMNSTPNIEKALDKMHVVGSLPSSMCRQEIGTTGVVGVIRYNETTKRKQMREWNNNKPKILEEVEDIKSKLNREGKN